MSVSKEDIEALIANPPAIVKKRKKAVNGKQKGNGFERDIANKLSDRFKEHLGLDQGFRRNPDSGSFFGGKNQQRTETHDTEFAVFGDLICPRTFKWNIECKNYKDAPSFDLIIKRNVKEWDKWLAQNEQDAVNAEKKPILIVKYNRTKIWAAIPTSENTEGLTPIITYKDYQIFTLDEILELDNSFFFQTENG